jgi:hypothetical protein
MNDLYEIVQNYPLLTPALSFASGAIVGTVWRTFQHYFQQGEFKPKQNPGWMPGGSAGAGALLAHNMIEHPTVGQYAIDAGAAMLGDYFATRAVDWIKNGRLDFSLGYNTNDIKQDNKASVGLKQ